MAVPAAPSLGKIEVVGADPLDDAADLAAAGQGQHRIGPVARERTQHRRQLSPARHRPLGTGVAGACAEPAEGVDGTERDQRHPGGLLQQHPVGPDVGDPADDGAAVKDHRDRRPGCGAEAVDEPYRGAFRSRAVGDLRVEVGPARLIELALQIGEQPLPPHRVLLPPRVDRRQDPTVDNANTGKRRYWSERVTSSTRRGRRDHAASCPPAGPPAGHAAGRRVAPSTRPRTRTPAHLRAVLFSTVVAAAYALGTAALWSGTAGPLRAVRASGPARFDDLVALCGAGGAWVVLTWLTFAFTVALASTAAGVGAGMLHRLSSRASPAVLRRLAAAVVGVGLATSPTSALAASASSASTVVATAAADPDEVGTSGSAAVPGSGSGVLGRIPVPDLDRPTDAHAAPGPRAAAGGSQPAGALPDLDRPTSAPWTPTRPAKVARTGSGVSLVTSARQVYPEVEDNLVVRRGDTLWSLVERHLGADATVGEIAREWPRWHAANRDVIGGDPDLLRPGQILRIPEHR